MLLKFANEDIFAVGAIKYLYAPATAKESTNRIIIPVTVEPMDMRAGKTIQTQAVLDTGAPYAILDPTIAEVVGFTPEQAQERERMLIRGMRLEGSLTRLSITLQATQGDDLNIETTAFIPDSLEAWGGFPSFLGMAGFIERLRFAIDPNEDKFYYGPL